MNDFFRSLLEGGEGAGTRIVEASIAALRRVSVVNNDLPARLGDVLGFFSAAPRPPASMSAVWGATADDLRLRRVKNRLSMSVVYDCLWTWRSYFGRDENRVDASDSTSFRVGSEGMFYHHPSVESTNADALVQLADTATFQPAVTQTLPTCKASLI